MDSNMKTVPLTGTYSFAMPDGAVQEITVGELTIRQQEQLREAAFKAVKKAWADGVRGLADGMPLAERAALFSEVAKTAPDFSEQIRGWLSSSDGIIAALSMASNLFSKFKVIFDVVENAGKIVEAWKVTLGIRPTIQDELGVKPDKPEKQEEGIPLA